MKKANQQLVAVDGNGRLVDVIAMVRDEAEARVLLAECPWIRHREEFGWKLVVQTKKGPVTV